jgi:hypothetical protein
VVNIAPCVLRAPVPIEQGAELDQEVEWTFFEKTKSLAPTVILTTDRPGRSLAPILTRQSWLPVYGH